MAHDRRFRFGAMLTRAESGAQVTERARKAEDLGYATIYVPDHFVDHPLAPMPTIAAVAAVTTSGDHYKITDLEGDPLPVQRPAPPVVIGGGAPRVLGFAAREADIVGINANLRGGAANDPSTAPSMNPASTDDKLGWVREAAGARFDDLEIQVLAGFVQITDDGASIAEMMAGYFETSPAEVLDSPVALVGTTDEIAESLRRRRERWQMSYHVVPIEQLDAFAPVVAQLAGT